MQPAFDRLWGGDRQMYVQRLGLARSLESNPMGAMHGVGVALAFGSDSPVTPLDPWGSVRAAVWHHNPVHRMSARAAFAAHSRGGWRARCTATITACWCPVPAPTFAVWETGALGQRTAHIGPRRRATPLPTHRPARHDHSMRPR